MKLQKKQIFGIVVGLVILAVAFALFFGEQLSYFLIVIASVVVILPFVLGFLEEQNKQKEKEEFFLAFTRDLVENVKTGSPINKSVINLRKREYGALSPHVQKIANQLTIGITLDSALKTFARETNNPIISRAIGLISEAEKAGGKIETVLESVAGSVNQIAVIKKERKASVSNLVTQGYIIFMIFIVIMLVLEFKILPLVTGLSGTEGLNMGAAPTNTDDFSMPLFIMLLVQSFFAGLVIGKISEGTVKKGIRHSFALIVITLLVTTGAKALFT
jgi:archaeal flagellar protein FlaJ